MKFISSIIFFLALEIISSKLKKNKYNLAIISHENISDASAIAKNLGGEGGASAGADSYAITNSKIAQRI
jgi:hypothetical protein